MNRAILLLSSVLLAVKIAPSQFRVGDVRGVVELLNGVKGDLDKEISIKMLYGYDSRDASGVIGATTDAQGKIHYLGDFKILSVNPATYDFLISVKGYRVHNQRYVEIGAANTVLDIKPKPIEVPGIPAKPSATPARTRSLYIRLVSFGQQPVRDCANDWPVPAGVITNRNSPIEGVSVSVLMRQATSGELREVASRNTGKDGRFALALDPKLLAGATEYVLTVRLKGFQPYVRVVYPCETLPAEIDLTPAELLKQGVLSETAEASYRFVYSPYLLQSLPLPGVRSFDSLALLSPGIAPSPIPWRRTGPGIAPGLGTPGPFIVNGLRGRQNNFVIDGADDNDEELGARRQGFVALVPQPAESIAEFQVVAALADATYGRDVGGQINAVTRSGSGKFHGDLSAYLTDNRFNARDFFTANLAAGRSGPPLVSDGVPVTVDGQPLATRSPSTGNYPFRRSQVEGNISGPILKPHSFFYLSFGGIVTTASEERHFSVPTIAQRGANGTGGTGFTQSAANLFFGPAVSFTPASLPGNGIFSLHPFPNDPAGPFGTNTWTTNLRADQHAYPFTIKTDHRARGVALAFRYSRAWESSDLPAVNDAIYSTIHSDIRRQSLAGYVDVLSWANISSSFRFSFGNTAMRLGSAGVQSPLASTLFPNNRLLLNAPLLLNVARPGIGSDRAGFVTANSPSGSQLLGLMGVAGPADTERVTGPLGQVRIAGFSAVGVDAYRFPQDRNDRTWQLGNLTTIARGPHTFRFGFDSRFTRLRSTQNRNERPFAEFHGVQGFGFLFGPPSLYTSAASMAAMGATTGMYETLASSPPPPLRLSSPQVDFFTVADFGLTRRIRVQAGLRYGRTPLPSDADEVIVRNFDYQALSAQVQQAERSCVPACPSLLNNVLAAFPGDFRSVFGAHPSSWDPRIGSVWDVTGRGSTIVRAGAGIYTGSFPALIVTESRSGFPTALPLNLANFPTYLGLNPLDTNVIAARSPYLFNLANPAVRALQSDLATILQANSLNIVNASLAPGGSDPIALLSQKLSAAYPVLNPVQPQTGLRHPWALQYGLSIEQRLGSGNVFRISYIATQGRRLLHVTALDRPPRTALAFGGAVTAYTNPQGAVTAPFPVFVGDLFPNLVARPPQGAPVVNGIGIMRTVFATDAASSYHSLQLDFRHRYSHGLLLGSALTWSHSIDNASDIFDDVAGFASPQNAFGGSERGSSDYDARLRSVTHFVYDIPAIMRSRFWRGWRLAGVYTAQSGHPYNITSSIDVNGDGLLTDRPNLGQGIIAANSTDPRRRVAIAPGLTATDLLAPRISGFTGGDGVVGRNAYVSWGFSNLDAALDRSFRIGESLQVTGRIEVFNVFNTTGFAAPVRVLEAPGFGQAVSTMISARRIQFGLRFQF